MEKEVATEKGGLENVTWAKECELDVAGDSFDLPMQGVKRSADHSNDDSNGNDDADGDDDGASNIFGTFRYHRGWV